MVSEIVGGHDWYGLYLNITEVDNFQPLRLARIARSMSSTVVLSFHPPASLTAEMRHTPAVPG